MVKRKINKTKKVEKITQKVGEKVGERGEKVAEVYFKNKGHTVVEKNYRKLRGEIDLITLEEDILHFIEVKTSTEHLPVLSGVSMTSLPLVFNDKGKEKYKNGQGSKDLSFSRGLNRENLHRDKIKKVIRIAEVYRAEKNIPEDIESQIDGLLVGLVYEGDRVCSVKVQYIPHIDRSIDW